VDAEGEVGLAPFGEKRQEAGHGDLGDGILAPLEGLVGVALARPLVDGDEVGRLADVAQQPAGPEARLLLELTGESVLAGDVLVDADRLDVGLREEEERQRRVRRPRLASG
jgi:hypothetical protein